MPACYSLSSGSAWEHGHLADNRPIAQAMQEEQKVVSTQVEVPCPAALASMALDLLPILVTKVPRQTEARLHTPTPRRRRKVGRNPVRTSQMDRISALPLNPRLIRLSRSRLRPRLNPSPKRDHNPLPLPLPSLSHNPNPSPSPNPSRSRAQLSHRQRHPRTRGKRHGKKSDARQKSGRPKRPRRSAGQRPRPA